MDLYQIKYFLSVVETGSFTRAARNENVTQPTLSAGIKKLEDQMGKLLFERTNKRVFLTDAGTSFLPHAKAIIHEVNLAKQVMEESIRRPLLKIGFLITFSQDLLSLVLGKFKTAYPDVEIELIDGTERELLNRLEDRTIDYAISLFRHDEPNVIPLYSEGYRFVMQKGGSLSGRKIIKPDDLVERNMIVRTRCEVLSETSRYFTASSIRPRLAYRTRNDIRALSMVEAGIGGALVPESVIKESTYKDRLDVFKLKGFDLKRTIGLFSSDSGQNNAEEFSDVVRSIFRDYSDSALSYKDE